MAGLTAEQRLARIEARLELQELLGVYALAVDDHDAVAVGECFTLDGVFGTPNSPVNNGRAEVVAAFEERFLKFGATLHVPRFQVLHALGVDTASGTVVGHAELAQDGDTVVTSFRYADDYAVEGGRWRFRSRIVHSLYAMTARELVSGGLSLAERKRWPGRVPSVAELPAWELTGP